MKKLIALLLLALSLTGCWPEPDPKPTPPINPVGAETVSEPSVINRAHNETYFDTQGKPMLQFSFSQVTTTVVKSPQNGITSAISLKIKNLTADTLTFSYRIQTFWKNNGTLAWEYQDSTYIASGTEYDAGVISTKYDSLDLVNYSIQIAK
jgi:PBP1b-binding outer membrane lipoprotein LpoB